MKKSLSIIIIILSIVPLGWANNKELDYKEIEQLKKKRQLQLDNNIALLIVEKGAIEYLKSPYYLDVFSIAELNKSQLRVLRNTIFAVHGYRFKSEDLKNHFAKFPWYSERYDDVVDKITNSEKIKIQRIKLFENQSPYKKNIVSNDDIVGLWHSSAVMASGWSSHFMFYKNGSFKYYFNSMAELPLIQSFSGTYQIKGNQLTLSIDERIVVKHNNKVTYSGAFGYEWENCKSVTERLPERKELNFPLSKIYKYKYEVIKYPIIEIGGIKYYKFYNNPNDK